MGDEAELTFRDRSRIPEPSLLGAGFSTGSVAPRPRPPCGQCPVRSFSLCSRVERRDLDRLFPLGMRIQARKAGARLFHQGEPFGYILILRSGWALVHKLFDDGERQIVRFVLPGDLIGFEGNEATGMAYTAEAITDVTYCAVKRSVFYRACAQSPRLAMNFASLVTREALSAWNHVGALGHQTAQGRVANLLLDLHRRITAHGDPKEAVLRIPLSQVHIADATGLTPVHVCRTLKQMRMDSLLDFRKGELLLLDPDRLADIAQLDPDVAPDDSQTFPPTAPTGTSTTGRLPP